MEPGLTRRQIFALGGITLAGFGLAACSGQQSPSFVSPTDAAVASVDARRARTGRTIQTAITAEPVTLDLAGKHAKTWGYRGVSALEPIRGNVGDTLRLSLTNHLPAPTTVHWHGLALRNDMDGVPKLTQKAVEPGQAFTYEFTLPHPGTYWFHPHVGTQLDRALAAPLIIDDPADEADYDREWILVLDDWLDGMTATPDDVLEELGRGMTEASGMDMNMDGGTGPTRMGNRLMGAEAAILGGDAGDVFYPLHLINGRPANDPQAFRARPGEKIRLRIINAGSDTAYRFGVQGHFMTITHSDGFPVQPLVAQSVVLGMGERYDATITADDGVFAVIAEALGKQSQAMAVLRTGTGSSPAPATKLPDTRRPTLASDMRAVEAVALSDRTVDRELVVELTGTMSRYQWGINGKKFDQNDPLRDALGVVQGERVRVKFKNSTRMWHPMHLHGHTYQHVGGGPRKDTSIVLPGTTLAVEFDADNPGEWLTHCHNAYHAESGMMAVIAYQQT